MSVGCSAFLLLRRKECYMEKIINVGGKDIKFKATAKTPLLYRTFLKRDIFKDIGKMQSNFRKIQEGDEEDVAQIETETVNILQMIAYVMAKQADSKITSDYDEWIDQFDMFAFYPVLNDILGLWGMNLEQEAQAKKNIEAQSAK